MVSRWVSVVLPFLLAIATLRDILRSPGVPGFRHDWGWPSTADQLRTAVWDNVSAWVSNGVGSGNPFPVPHPLFVAWWSASWLVSPAAVYKVTILLAIAALAGGGYALARRTFALSIGAASFVAAIVALFPPVYTKIVSGHTYYLVAAAFGIWAWVVLATPLHRWTPRTALLSAVLVACTALQVQLLVICLLALAVRLSVYVVASPRRLPSSLAAFVVVSSLLWAELYGIGGGDALATLSPLRTTLFYEYNNSSSFMSSLVADGYFAGYSARAYGALAWSGAWHNALYVLPVLALAGGVTAIRRPAVRVAALLWVLFTALVAGLDGPLAAPLGAAFVSLPSFSMFRELYHFALPAVICGGLLAAVALDRLPRAIAVAVAAVPVIASAAPWTVPQFAGQLHSYVTAPSVIRALRGVESTAPSRFLLLPASLPISSGEFPSAGNDPDAYGLPGHPVANSYRTTGALELAIARTERGGVDDATARRAIVGIGAAIVRPELSTRWKERILPPRVLPADLKRAWDSLPQRRTSAVRPTPVSLAFVADRLPIVVDPLASAGADGYLLVDDLGRAVVRPRPPVNGIDPSLAWVDARSWDFLDDRITAAAGGLLTWSRQPLQVPSGEGAVELAGSSDSVVKLGGRSLGLGAARRWLPVPAGSSIVVQRGWCLVVAWAPRTPLVTLPPALTAVSGTPRKLFELPYDPDTHRASGIIPAGVHWIVLKESWSPRWSLESNGAQVIAHVPFAGYGNAWVVSNANPVHVVIRYAPQTIASALAGLGLAVWSVTALFLIATGRRVNGGMS